QRAGRDGRGDGRLQDLPGVRGRPARRIPDGPLKGRELRARLLRRLASLLVTALLVSTITFLALRVLPGDLARLIVGTDGDPAAVERIRALLGYDRPVLVQLWDWLGGLVLGDLGT